MICPKEVKTRGQMLSLIKFARQNHHSRKTLLIELGQWAVETRRGWLVRAVDAAIEREGLRDASPPSA